MTQGSKFISLNTEQDKIVYLFCLLKSLIVEIFICSAETDSKFQWEKLRLILEEGHVILKLNNKKGEHY